MVNPLVTQQIEDLTVNESSEPTIIDLTTTFDDPSTTGQIARFEFADNINDGGTVDVLLFDQEDVGAPATAENFLNYVEDGDYNNTIVHRSIADFIIQGGGFAVEDSQVVELPADESVVNEFSPERSNLERTIAMAKLGGDPNSATNQWFFNLGDNSENLDNQNGGFTVFGEVLNESEFESVEAIADLERVNGVPVVDSPLTLNDVPITDAADPIDTEDFVYLESVTALSEGELEYSVVSNSNEELVDASITDGELTLDPVDGQTGEATITLEATNLLGESIEEAFVINVEATPEEVPESEDPVNETPVDEITDLDPIGSNVFRFLDPDTGVHFYANSEAERDELLANEPDYVAEDLGYRNVDPSEAGAQEVFSFFNEDTGAYLYTTDDNERDFIEDNLDNYSQESDSFSVFTEEQENTIPIYRLLNTSTGAHFYTPSSEERDAIEDSLPNYESEGIAFYAFEAGE